jgi:hypothetical protein
MQGSLTPMLPRSRAGPMACGHQGLASNPNRKGGSVSAQHSIARNAQRDNPSRLCERHCGP